MNGYQLLKVGTLKTGHAQKMNFVVAAADTRRALHALNPRGTPVDAINQAPPAAYASIKSAAEQHDRQAVANLDLAFQLAVKRNDAATMDKILHEDFTLVLGNGTVVSREELLNEARARTIDYEIQDEDPGTQRVTIFGDTAVVTARLWIKGRKAGQQFERRLWFSDTYVRTSSGWRYAFAQASLPLSGQ